ncbi:hypothetical protein ERO13_D05G140601v2 [Gossypium hirsutum]|nr:hypothetical protein ERO13_D05G140601v2 [Gossypium hirsutum]
MVYLQYSNRQEIVNNKTTADIAGNVLLVTIEGQDAWLVSIDVLHLDHVKGIISNGNLVHPEKEHMYFQLLDLCIRLLPLRRQLDFSQGYIY